MKLFLSGGGSGEKSRILDKKFVATVGKAKPILYIPLAIDKKRYPYPECFKWINKTFNPLGLKKIELWTEKELKQKPESELKQFGGIYIGGGNTFYLLQELKDSGFLSKLDKLIKKDVPVYGGSAGAIICGKTILTSHDENFVGLKNFDGMNLVNNFDLWCHYEPSMDNEILQYKQKYGLNVIALPEDCGLYVTNEIIEVVGPGSACIIDGGIKKLTPGKSFC